MTASPISSQATGASALDARQRAVLARVADAERAAILTLPTDDPLDAKRRRRVAATRGELLAQPEVVHRNWAGNRDPFCRAFAARHVPTGDPVDATHAGAAAARLAVSAPGWTGIAAAVARP